MEAAETAWSIQGCPLTLETREILEDVKKGMEIKAELQTQPLGD